MPEKNDILNIDGEIVGSTPVKVKMMKHAFHVFA
jgi:diacylglycerol kinase family enzyme